MTSRVRADQNIFLLQDCDRALKSPRHPIPNQFLQRAVRLASTQEDVVKIFTWKRAAAAAFCVFLTANHPVPLIASDHADPQALKDPDGNITDLFFFPDGDRYVVILDVHRALAEMPPYQLSQYEYKINFDWHTGVSFPSGDADTVRYGGKISQPDKIMEDATITIHLDNDGHVVDKDPPTYSGLLHQDQIQKFAGVRADPFIFPRFFQKNIVAMVFSIPKNAFPAGRDTFLIWAAAFKRDTGKQVDHVGRSNRTQQARFEPLNTLHPSQHVAQIMKDKTFWDDWFDHLKMYRETQQFGAAIQILVQIRSKKMYDFTPDVMVYSDAREHDPNARPGFPNGRHIQDDVAAITCAEGDCILQELSYIEGDDFPRKTVSDRPVPVDAKFPYLLEPYDEGAVKKNPLPSPLPSLGLGGLASLGMLAIKSIPRLIELEFLPWNMSIVVLLIIIAVIALVVLWLVIQGIKYRLMLRRQRQAI
jgi:hypothetical protein